jgi:hypothetical protein
MLNPSTDVQWKYDEVSRQVYPVLDVVESYKSPKAQSNRITDEDSNYGSRNANIVNGISADLSRISNYQMFLSQLVGYDSSLLDETKL